MQRQPTSVMPPFSSSLFGERLSASSDHSHKGIKMPSFRSILIFFLAFLAIGGGKDLFTQTAKESPEQRVPNTSINESGIMTLGIIQARNIANPCVAVDSQGAVGDGITDDRQAFQKAIEISKLDKTNAICLSKNKRYLVASIGGTIRLPGDNGLCPPIAANCKNMPPEDSFVQAYSISFPSNFKIYGNGAEVVGPWTSNRRVGLDVPYTFVCSSDTSRSSIQPQFKGSPSYVLNYGNCSNVIVQDLKFEHTFVAMFIPGMLSNSIFDRLTFGTTGIEMLVHYADRNVFTNWQGNNSYAGKIVGGWWIHRCCTGDSRTDDIAMGGYNDLEVTNRYVVTQMGDPTKDAEVLDKYFDTYFYKSANTDNERALQHKPTNQYHGIFGMGLITYSRYGRPSNNGILDNIVCEGQVRQCIYSDATWYQATINSVAEEGMGYCHGPLLGGPAFGSQECPDPYGFGKLSPAPIIFNSNQPIGSVSIQSLQVPNSNYQSNIGGRGISVGTASITNSQQVEGQIEPGNNGVWKSGQPRGRAGLSFPSSRLQMYGLGVGDNGTNTDDGWAWQSFPPRTSSGDDALNFAPLYNPQLGHHNYYVKIPGLSICPTLPKTSNTELTGCNSTPLKGITGFGSEIVSDVAPIIRANINDDSHNAITIQSATGVDAFNVDGRGRLFMNNHVFFQDVTKKSVLTSTARAQWRLSTEGSYDILLAPNAHDAVHIHNSGGVTIGSGPDPGSGNLYVEGGLTRTIHIGSCSLVIKGGIITSALGAC